PSGPPVMTYCMLAVAPGRSGWPSAILADSSSHSCERYLAISPLLRRWMRWSGIVASDVRLGSAADALAHAREQVVLGDRRVDERAGSHVVVVGVHRAGDLGREAEPERRVGVDLRGVGQQAEATRVVVVGDVDAGRDAIVLRRPLEPLL